MKHDSIIDQWPSLAAFAEEIGLSYQAAKAMRRRASIPGCYWLRIEEVAQSRGFTTVTLRALAEGTRPKTIQGSNDYDRNTCQPHPVSKVESHPLPRC